MKKVFAITLALVLMLSMLPMAAFADNRLSEVQDKIVAARDYLYGNKAAFSAQEGYDFALFLAAGGDGTPFKNDYVQSVKDAFEAGTMNTADRVALAAFCLEALGEDIESFELNDSSKVNLIDKIKENGTTVDSPYNYLFVLAMCEDDEAYCQQVINALTDNYTSGQGYNYWGFATDNTANFGALMALADAHPELVEDAEAVIETAKKDAGYYYCIDYGDTPNGNSTACALYFYAMEGNQDKADEAYDLLANYDLGDGSYHYMNDGANAFATKDALKALLAYASLLDSEEEPADDVTTGAEDVAPAVDSEQQAKQSTPPTGDSAAAVAVAGAAMVTLGMALALRKKEDK